MLNLRVVRGPLKDEEYAAILTEYNRLTGSKIPLEEFVHWVKESPVGPSWHGILETDEGRIVGHDVAIPMPNGTGTSGVIPAKAEYGVLHEDFRSQKVRGYETSPRPAFLVLLEQMFQKTMEFGWGPIFTSTNEKNQVFTRKVGLRAVEFRLWECLLILKPGKAAAETPNLTKWQRAAFFAAGLAHGAVWPVAASLLRGVNGIQAAGLYGRVADSAETRIAFFEDEAALKWRFLDGQYVRYAFEERDGDYLIAKRGGEGKYLRVCQFRLDAKRSVLPILGALVRQARKDGAAGVRWAVYAGEAGGDALVQQMKRSGFLCAPRKRTLMVHKQEAKYLEAGAWKVNDALFSFDP